MAQTQPENSGESERTVPLWVRYIEERFQLSKEGDQKKKVGK